VAIVVYKGLIPVVGRILTDYWNLYFIIRKKGREHSKYLFLFQQSNHFYSKSFKNSSNASLNASGCSIFIMLS
ncbi:hypothetical protein LI167_19435, partial [Phocaeicola dorei]|nr:hypothetical protein [Phocaeicola dorei]